MCLCKSIAHLPITLENYSNPQKTWQACNEKNSFILGFGFFVSDVISGVHLDLFGPLHLALGTNHEMVVFRLSFYWKLG